MGVVTQRYTFSGSGEDFGVRKGRRLVVLHTFENSDPLKNTMRDALAGAIWQDRNDTLGSYNRLIAVDGVLGCVPDHRISGGMNPASSGFKPLAWLYSMLPATVVNDPNSYSLQLCAMGRKAYYDTNGWPPAIIDGFARSIIEEEQATGEDMVVANHADFQPPPNRFDAGPIAMSLVMARYHELTGGDMPILTRPVREKWKVPSGTEFYTGGPELGELKLFTTAVELWSNGETLDGLWRRLEYHNTPAEGEDLWVKRSAISPISGTRNPSTGFGEPTLSTGYTQAQLDAAKAEGVKSGKAAMKAKAIVAAENHESVIRALT